MSTATGKTARKQFGGNRYTVHKSNHKPKSDAKIKRMGWIRIKK